VPIGLEDVSKYPSLFQELQNRGWTDAELKQLAGLNLIRVFRAVEQVNKKQKYIHWYCGSQKRNSTLEGVTSVVSLCPVHSQVNPQKCGKLIECNCEKCGLIRFNCIPKLTLDSFFQRRTGALLAVFVQVSCSFSSCRTWKIAVHVEVQAP
jgi:hypothetical protein